MKLTRMLKCKWCNKERIANFGRGWDKRKFCCDRCRQEYHSFNDKRSPFFKINKNKKEILADKRLYVKCEICGQLARRRLSTHIRTRHNLKWKEYIKTYPNAKNECEEIRETIYTLERYKPGIENCGFKNGWKTITTDRKRKLGCKCELCGFNKYPEAIIGHHKIPTYVSGKNRIENCLLVCSNCHWHLHKLIREIIKSKSENIIEDIIKMTEKLKD